MHAKKMFRIDDFLNHSLHLVFFTSWCHPALESKQTQKTLWNKYGWQIECTWLSSSKPASKCKENMWQWVRMGCEFNASLGKEAALTITQRIILTISENIPNIIMWHNAGLWQWRPLLAQDLSNSVSLQYFRKLSILLLLWAFHIISL